MCVLYSEAVIHIVTILEPQYCVLDQINPFSQQHKLEKGEKTSRALHFFIFSPPIQIWKVG